MREWKGEGGKEEGERKKRKIELAIMTEVYNCSLSGIPRKYFAHKTDTHTHTHTHTPLP